jgi:hypothetical protein
MTAHGFNAKAVGQSFYRSVPGGRWAFHISFIRHPNDLDVTADVAVRIDAIEQVVNEWTSGLTNAEKRGSFTLGAELGNLTGRQPLRWTLSGVDSVEAVAEEILAAFEQIGLPYLSNHSDAESAYRILTSTEIRDLLQSPILGARCMRAVAAAHLLGRSELWPMILEFDAKLAAQNDLYLSDFRALAQSLGTM